MFETISKLQNRTWFALADTEICRLLCCSLTRRGKYHVGEYDVLKNTLPQQEHSRPQTDAGTTHYQEDNERRFGGQIVEWLKNRVTHHEIDHLVIFAPPRILGILRKVPLGGLKEHVEELQGDLMRLSPGQLADHPMIRELLPQHSGNGRASADPAALSAGTGRPATDRMDVL